MPGFCSTDAPDLDVLALWGLFWKLEHRFSRLKRGNLGAKLGAGLCACSFAAHYESTARPCSLMTNQA